MILFSVSNFKSIDRTVVLSMKSSTDNSHVRTVLKSGRSTMLPAALIYGANATGKSSILDALRCLQRLVSDKATIVAAYNPHFASNHPTELGIIFVNEGIRYAYNISFNNHAVISEYLFYWPNGREALIFSREGSAFKFPKGYQSFASLTKQIASDELFLVIAKKQLAAPYEWLARKLHFMARSTVDETAVINKELLETMRRLLTTADFGISDFKMTAGAGGKSAVMCRHQITNDAGESTEYWLPLTDESHGVQRFFDILIPIAQVLCNGGIAVIDDLDLHLHPLLLRELLRLFQCPGSNPGGGQLIGAVHDTALLDLNLLRRDQIYFMNRHEDSQATNLYSLWDFSARKDENVQKGYLQGRYGAMPFLRFDEVFE